MPLARAAQAAARGPAADAPKTAAATIVHPEYPQLKQARELAAQAVELCADSPTRQTSAKQSYARGAWERVGPQPRGPRPGPPRCCAPAAKRAKGRRRPRRGCGPLSGARRGTRAVAGRHGRALSGSTTGSRATARPSSTRRCCPPPRSSAYDRAVGHAGDAPYSRRDLLAAAVAFARRNTTCASGSRIVARASARRALRRSPTASRVAEATLAPTTWRSCSSQPELRVALELVPLRCGPSRRAVRAQRATRGAGGAAAARRLRPQRVQRRAPAGGGPAARAVAGRDVARAHAATRSASSTARRRSSRRQSPKRCAAVFVHGAARARRTSAGRGWPAPARLRSTRARRSTRSVPLPGFAAARRGVLASDDGFHELPAAELVPDAPAAHAPRAADHGVSRSSTRPTASATLAAGATARGCRWTCSTRSTSRCRATPAGRRQAGSYRIDVAGASPDEKLTTLDAAARAASCCSRSPVTSCSTSARTTPGTPMALHALGEYAQPCAGGGETIVDVQRTVVSDLSLGAGSSRKSLLERVETLVVFGKASGGARARAPRRTRCRRPRRHRPRPAATAVDARIFVSPARPRAPANRCA